MGDGDQPEELPVGSNLFQTTQRAEQVQAWAQRMRDKRAAREAAAAAEAQPDTASYWSAQALFEDSRHVEHEERLTSSSAVHRTELLASLGLGAGATAREITDAFRSLAKLHHPDRYTHAPADVQAHHADAMARINTTYQALKAPPDTSLPERRR